MIEEAKKPVRLVWVPHIFTPNSHHLLGRPWEYHKASVGRSRGHHHCSTWSHVLLYLTTCTHKHLGCVPAAYSHRTCVLFTPKLLAHLNKSARRVTGRRRSRETSLRLVFCAPHHPTHPWCTPRRECPDADDRCHTYSKHDGMRSQRGQMATSAPQSRPGRRGWPRRDRRPPPGRPQLARRRLRAAHAACGTLSRRAHTQADELGESAARGRNLLRESDEEGRVRGGRPGRGAAPLSSGCGGDAQR